MPTWKLTLEYDGTRYHGWQEQKNARAIAGELRSAAGGFFDGPVEVGGAGRTDGGVHALAQVAHLKGRRRVTASELLRGINDRLPPDINLIRVEEAPHRFDARHSAVARYYLYQISTRRSAFAKRFVWWVKDPLDLGAMTEAAQLLPGMHDFSAFCDKRIEEERSSLVLVHSAELARHGDLILFRIGASHFLWKMVRRITGMLVEIGRGTASPKDFGAALQPGYSKKGQGLRDTPSGTPKKLDIAAKTAPASGLFLELVSYSAAELPGKLEPALSRR
ncbi:MAG TPA: tRNA pseudouridine(38-40) synthase TruA [Blastocatellia bacterium]|nr:tRNA pseudouridine(38-40) synthase TruA [Blastocatellia bacterium]